MKEIRETHRGRFASRADAGKSRLALVMFMLLTVSGGAAPALADAGDRVRPGAGQSVLHGLSELGFTEQGVLQVCAAPPPGEALIRVVVRSTFERLAGVCDDQTERPCAGRVTQVYERCVANDVVYPIDSDAFVRYAQGLVRICYDETGAGNCSDVDEVARGRQFEHVGEGLLAALASDDPSAFDFTVSIFGRQVITDSSVFELNGRKVRVPKGTSQFQAFGRINDRCAFVANACPGFTIQTQR
jgi:hypothetical protein